MDPERIRIRSYLQAQAAKLTVAEIVGKVRDAMAELRSAAESPGPTSAAPAAGDWSVAEVVAHVVAAGEQVATGIAAVLDNGTRPAAVDAQAHGTPGPVGAALEALETGRTTLFARVLAAAGDEHLDMTWRHPFFGELNWREWLLFLRLHDLDHARQLSA